MVGVRRHKINHHRTDSGFAAGQEAAGEEDDCDEAVAGLTPEEREWFKNSNPLPMVEGPCISQVLLNHPDSKYMRQHFLDQNDPKSAALFRPSSMETIRALGGDPLTLVSEMPLFITPGVGEELGPPDPVAEEWKKKLFLWRSQLERDRPAERIRACARSGCLSAMPIADQMRLQWTMIASGIIAVGEQE